MRTLILIASIFFLSACDQKGAMQAQSEAEKTLSEVKKAVLADLKDPESAKFGQFTQVGDNHACIEVNARNSFGGYTGAKPFGVQKIDGKWTALTSMNFPYEICLISMKEMSERESKK